MKVETLTERLLFSTVRITADSPEGRSVGTGFAFVYESGNVQGPIFFMVTNKHVITDAADGAFVFSQANENGELMLGHRLTVPVQQFEAHWHGHPDDNIDITVCYLNPMIEQMEEAGHHTFVSVIGTDHVATPDRISDLDAVEDVMFIGYPDGLYDEVNLTPIIRRGTTATPLQLDYGGETRFLDRCFRVPRI